MTCTTVQFRVCDEWLKKNIAGYYEWAKQHNSLLILTFDESDKSTLRGGLTNPADKDPNKIRGIELQRFLPARISNQANTPKGRASTTSVFYV